MRGEAWRLLLPDSRCAAALQHPADVPQETRERTFGEGGLKPGLQDLSLRLEL